MMMLSQPSCIRLPCILALLCAGCSGGGEVPEGAFEQGGSRAFSSSGGNASVAIGGQTTVSSAPSFGGANATGSVGTSKATPLPSRSQVLASLRLANDYFVNQHPDPTVDISSPDRARPSNLWTRAVYFEGLMGLYAVETDAARKTSYYDYAVTWGASPSHSWAMTYTPAGTMTTDADNQACGQTYIDLYRIDPNPERIAAVQANLENMITKNVTNAWTWIDAIQMAMPSFAKLGTLLDDTRYYEQMYCLYAYTRNTLGGGTFDEPTGLWWRDDTFTPDAPERIKSRSGKDIYWSRGNGWVMAALARVLENTPTTEAHRSTYVADLQTMASALVPLQRNDGFWNVALTESTFCRDIGKTGEDGPEESGTALFTFALAWGIRTGVLDAATYGPVVSKAWNGLVTTSLHSDGFLGWVQSTGKQPCDGSEGLGYDVKPNFDDYGVGCFLLAGSEVYRLSMP